MLSPSRDSQDVAVLMDALRSAELWTGVVLGAAVAAALFALPGMRRTGVLTAVALLTTWWLLSPTTPLWQLLAGLAAGEAADRAAPWLGGRPALLPLLVPVAAVGVWGCVPDTERALAVIGVVAMVGSAVAVARPPGGVTSLALIGATALLVVAVRDAHRPSAQIGSAAIVAALLLATWLTRRGAMVVLPVAAAAIGISSRVAGMGPDTGRSWLVGGLACVVVGLWSGAAAHVSAGRAAGDAASRPR